jgi:N-acetyl sugar amidotransferase
MASAEPPAFPASSAPVAHSIASPLPDVAPEVAMCSRCLYDSTIHNIEFDDRGVCSYCKLTENLEQEYPAGGEGEKRLQVIVDQIKREGRGNKFDVVVGVSGGCDSSYTVALAVRLGLRPLAVHFDNTWNSTIATENIHRVLGKLKVELHTHVVDNEVYDDIYRAFMLAGVPDIEAPTDIGLAATMYQACEKFGVKYQFNGHNFRTEGVSPLGWLYMDGKYIESVVRKYGNYRKHRLRTYPNMPLWSFLKWTGIKRIKQIRPLWYMDLNKEQTKQFLSNEFGWQWYGGHHLENRFTAFYHSYFLPRRFQIDGRKLGYSALIRGGQMSREEGLELIAQPPVVDPEVVELVKKRLRFSDAEFERVMTQPKHNYTEFKTYKPTFERLRPLFYVMYKANLVPKSFYVKYTSRTNL